MARGHEAHVIAYGGPSVLDDEFRGAGVDVVASPQSTYLGRIRSIREWMRRTNLDVVHAVLRRASTLALIARWPRPRPPLITTDMSSATYGRKGPALLLALAGFALADRVVTQTELNRTSIVRLAPWLRGKTVVIRNGLDTERFSPHRAEARDSDEKFTFCVVGTLTTVKNPFRVVDAVVELRRRGYNEFRVDWYGRDGAKHGQNVGAAVREYAAERGAGSHLFFHGDTPEIERAYGRADALLHASVQEGFPNAVVEGMSCGLPVVVSGVADLPQLVSEARNGFVFDETDAGSIADAMERLLTSPEAERACMGGRSREAAVRWFRAERFVGEFETLYRTLSAGRSS